MKEITLKVKQVKNGFIIETRIHNNKIEPDAVPSISVAYDVEDLKAHLHDAHDILFGKDD